MALLESIRSKAGTIVLIVIGLALFSFVMQDMFSSGNSMFRGNATALGEINGKTVQGEEFQRRLSVAEENLKRNQGLTGIDENTRQQLINQIWNDYLDEYLFNEEMEEAGVEVSGDELFDMIQGDNIDPQVMQIPAFQDSITKQFDRNLVLKFIKTQLTEENDPDGIYRNSWAEFEQALMKQRRKNKYNALIRKAVYVTTAQAKRDFLAKNESANIRFVAKRYDSEPDSTYTVTDEDLKKYYNENKFEFEQKEETRKVDYVVFQVNPSAEDRMEMLNSLINLKADFQTTTNDTAFVNANSEEGFRVATEKRGGLSPQINDSVFSGTPGRVYGPFIEGDQIKLLKLIGFSASSDSAKARHILISTRELPVAAAMIRADSMKSAIKGGADFAELARKFSEDPGSGAQGGDLGWFTEGQMVPEFNDACFNGKVGDLTIVTTQFGVHIINLQDKTKPSNKAKVVYINRNIEPSSKTIDEYYAKANDFAVSSQNYEAFKEQAKSRSLFIVNFENVKPSDRQVNDLANSREMVQWMYNPERSVNDISKVFDFDGKYVVAALTGMRDKGIPPFDQLKEAIKPLAIREKKAEKFRAEFEKALAGTTSIDELGTKMGSAANRSSMTFSAYSIPAIGNEPVVIGKSFAITPNKLSEPIKGKSGMYVILVESVVKNADLPADLKEQKQSLVSSLTGRVDSNVNAALVKTAKVEDMRYKFF
jgi:peptidyl-prolyl cis-trans isomerase D